MGMLAYAVLYLSYYISVEYFVTFTVIYGSIQGVSLGMAQMVICISPLAWLDKKRSQWIPFLFLGAAAGPLIIAPFVRWMISEYTSR